MQNFLLYYFNKRSICKQCGVLAPDSSNLYRLEYFKLEYSCYKNQLEINLIIEDDMMSYIGLKGLVDF